MSLRDGIRAAARSPSSHKALTAETMIAAGYPAGGGETGRRLPASFRRWIVHRILSDSMGKLPCFIMDGKTRERVALPVLKLLNVRPNEAMTPFIRKRCWRPAGR